MREPLPSSSAWSTDPAVTPTFWENPVTVRVPATSANLGPGFDSLGLALSLNDEVTASATSGGVRVLVEGEGADAVPRDESHLIITTMHRTFAAMEATAPGIDLRCINRIPHARGLGSSSAAIVAGAMLARGLLVDGDLRLTDDDLLALVVEIEGHPDNVAPCLLGGLVIAWTDDADGHPRAVSLPVLPVVEPIVLVPAVEVSTALARSLLPATVTHHDAAVNSGRAALLIDAMTREPANLLAATRDLLHQDARQTAMPDSHALMLELRAAGVAAAISGAGPSVMALVASDAEREAFAAVVANQAELVVHPMTVDSVGAMLIAG